MNTIELQNNIIRLVLDIDDDELLSYINSLLQKGNEQSYYEMSELEKLVVKESMQEYKKGEIIESDELFSRNKKWLEE